VKSDKDGVVRKVKGDADRITTDSSAVSTPSTADPETAALKVKAAEVPEATSAVSETDKLRKGKEEIPVDKTETHLAKPEQEKAEEINESKRMAADEVQLQAAAFTVDAQEDKHILPPGKKGEEGSPLVEAETEREGMEEDEEIADKESEIGKEMPQIKQRALDKDETEATEDTEYMEDEEEGEEKQQIDGRKSLADELEFDAKELEEIKVEEGEDEEDEYLIIEREEVEQFMEDSLQDQESVESHIPEELEDMERGDEEEEDEGEGELNKHLRDEVESEKEKKHKHEKDIIKVNGFHEEHKDITEKEDREYIREGKHSPLMTEDGEEKGETAEVAAADKAVAEKEAEVKITEPFSREEEAVTKQTAVSAVAVSADTTMSTVAKEQLQEEVQGIISVAKEIVTKTKQETEIQHHGTGEVHVSKDEIDLLEEVCTEEKKDTDEGDEVKEASSVSPEEKLDISSEKNREVTDDTRGTDQKLNEEEDAEIKASDQRYAAEESQPDERFSTTVESAATTAPTLPEDERIPLDEIKEIVEEKYVKEETKEEKSAPAAIVSSRYEQPTTLPQVVVAAGVGTFDPMAPRAVVHLERDIVKTPDEVADLPVHEEVDPGMYESDEFSRDFKGKSDTAKKQVSQQDLEDSKQQASESDFKGKNDAGKKQVSQQELEDSKQQASEADFKGTTQLKRDDDDIGKTPFDDSKFVEEKASLPAANKDELKATFETESKKKTEKAEGPEAPNTDLSADKDKVDGSGKLHDLKEEKGLSDEKETAAHVITKQEEKVQDTDKLLATAEAVPKSDEVEHKKTVSDTEVPEQLSKDSVKADVEKGKVESPLEKGTESSKLVREEGVQDVVQQQVLDKSKETSKPETEGKSISRQEETSGGEGQTFDSKDEIKHMTEKFIEKEIRAVRVEASEAEPAKQECEEDIATEKTDVEKPVQEESEDEKASEDLAGEISEAETCELKDMDLKERGKELESLEKEAVKTEEMKYSEEKGELDKFSPEEKVHDHEKHVVADMTPEEAAMQTEPVQEKTDVQKAQFEEEKLDADKAVTKEKVEDFITEPDDSGTGNADHPEFEKHVTKESDTRTQSPELKQTAGTSKADIMEPEEADVGSIETKTKDITAVKEIILTKEGSAVDVDKDIDEREKVSKDLSSISEDTEGDKTDISKLNMSAAECEVPNLTAKEELAGKPSPGALSLTYLEIIDKLQKDSQKADDSITTAKESSLLTEVKQDASGDPSTDQVSDTLSKDDKKTNEKSETDITESVTETRGSQISDIKGMGSVEMTTEIKYDETAGDSNNAITKTDEVDSGESAGEKQLITPGESKVLPAVTEFVPVISEEDDTETETGAEYDKSRDKDVTEAKPDRVPDVCKLKEPVTTGPSQQTDEDSKGDAQKTVGSETELKLTDDKDDSYGDGSISPDEAYVDSGLEEEPVYRKLEAAEHPEFVTVTPDSAPQSPKSHRDKKSSMKTDEEVLQQESPAAVKTALERTELGTLQEDARADSEKARHEPPNDDLAIADKRGSTTGFDESATDLVAGTPKKEAEAAAATADTPGQISVPEGQREVSVIPSSDRPSRSGFKTQELGEANVLEDLVSASQSAIAEIEGKLSTQMEEILAAPRKESDQTKSETHESKSEISTLQALYEDEEEANSSPKLPTETGETMFKIKEDVEHESYSVLTGKAASEKSMGESDRKPEPTEDTSSTELCSTESVLTSHTADTGVTQEKIYLDHDTEKNVPLREITTPSTAASVISEEVTAEADISRTTKQEVTVDQSTKAAAVVSADAASTTTASISSTVTVSCSGNLTGSVPVCRMVMTASSEDGGMETELCSSSTLSTEPTALELPVSSSDGKQRTGLTEQDTAKGTEDDASKGHVSETRTANGDMYTGDDSASEGEGHSKLVTRTTQELTETDELGFDEGDNMEVFAIHEIGEDGTVITRTVKTARNFVTAGDESDDSDFEDEDNIESTAAEDGSDSSRMSKITTSLTTAIKTDDNGVRSFPTDTADKTAGDVVTKTTTTTITTLSSDEPGEVVTTTTTKEIIIGDGSTPHDITKDADVVFEKEQGSKLDLTENSKPDSSPLKVTTTDITHCIQAQEHPVAIGLSAAGGAEKESKLTGEVGSKEEEKKVVNGKGSEAESMTEGSTTAVGKTVPQALEEPSFAAVKNEAQTGSAELTRCATPGSDVASDSDLDVVCGPLTARGSIGGTKDTTGSCEDRPDSQRCDSDEEDDDEPGSPLSVTSQLPPSPPSNFYFEMSDRVTPDYEATSAKYKEVPSSMTSSLYETFPPETFREFVKEERETGSHFPSSSTDETAVKCSGAVLSEDSVMTSSLYGSLDTDNKGTVLRSVDNSQKRLQEDEPLDFERAKYEHRAARGKDLTDSSQKYEYQYMAGINGQKLKDDNSFHDLNQDYGNANVAAGKRYEDLMNQNRDTKGMEYRGKIAARFADQSGSGSHPKQTEHISADIPEDKKEASSGASGIDPAFQHQFPAPATSASSFPEPPQGFAQSSGLKEDNKKDPIADWGKPLGLPAPTPPPTNNSNIAGEDLPSTPKREKKVMQIKKTMNESNKAASGKDSKLKRPDSPMKRPISEKKLGSNKEGGKNVGGGKASGSPIYINLTYVPHHGNSYYTTLEFFKKVRARYYVFSGTEPSREVYNALLDAKQTWEDKELGMSICSSK
jgi:hypothetical protein